MNIFKQLYFRTCASLPLSLIESGPAPAVLLPYHHVVSDAYLPHIYGLYGYKNTQQFRSDLDWLLRHREPIHPDEIFESVKNQEPITGKRFLLTFDDGFREIHDIVAPILEELGLPAIFFVNPAFLNNKELFYRCKISLIIEQLKTIADNRLKPIAEILNSTSTDMLVIREKIRAIHYPQRAKADELGDYLKIDFDEYLSVEAPFMTTTQVLQLHEAGFTIGAHSMDHPEYKYLSLNEQVNQTLDSLHYVKNLTGSSKGFFSFPHTDKNVRQEFFNRVTEDELGTNTLFFGTQNQRREEHNRMFHRFNAEDPRQKLCVMAKGVMVYSELCGARLRT